jgi:ferredoxin-NADP reductase
VHAQFGVGLRLNTALPGNDFVLHDDTWPAVLIAGGIGITPIRARAYALRSSGRDFRLHYAARSPPRDGMGRTTSRGSLAPACGDTSPRPGHGSTLTR